MKLLKITIRLLVLATCLSTTTGTFADGTLSFAKINNASCTLAIPPNGSGATWQYELAGNKERCEDNEQEYVIFDQFPSASTIILTDSDTCSTQLGDNNGFYFIIRTTKKVSTTRERIQLNHLADFGEGQVIYPGFMLEKFGTYNQSPIHRRLSCIRITVSSEKNMPDKDIVIARDTEWSPGQEEGISNFTCPGNSFMLGRKHYGDYEGQVQHLCGTLANHPGFKLINPEEKEVNEASADYSCPRNKVLIGVKRNVSQPGLNITTYRCATLTQADGKTVNQVRGQWTEPVKERDSTTVCEPNEVMVGRYHTGDHEGHTRIRCAALQNTPAPPEL